MKTVVMRGASGRCTTSRKGRRRCSARHDAQHNDIREHVTAGQIHSRAMHIAAEREHLDGTASEEEGLIGVLVTELNAAMVGSVMRIR